MLTNCRSAFRHTGRHRIFLVMIPEGKIDSVYIFFNGFEILYAATLIKRILVEITQLFKTGISGTPPVLTNTLEIRFAVTVISDERIA